MNIQSLVVFSLVCLPFGGGLWGQKQVELKNPSFESPEPGAGIVPLGWINIGASDQSQPDIQPGFFNVSIPAQDGGNYLGLVVRENNTWEGVGQRLSGFLHKDSIYSFSLWLTRSNSYQSAVQGGSEIRNFNNPTILKIWGYNTKTAQEELLAESQPVGHSKWVRYDFVLSPSLTDFDELDLMAYFAPGFERMNGNLLIDNCSPIVETEK